MATKPNLSDHVSLLFELHNRIPRLGLVTASELQQQLANIGIKRDIRATDKGGGDTCASFVSSTK